MPTCNIRKNSYRGELLNRTKLIVWDECTMAHKNAFEAVNRCLQDIKGNQLLMGGVLLILSGDFRQTLPIVSRGTPVDEYMACIKSSVIWPRTLKFHLTRNMRAENDQQFAEELINIGEDLLQKDNNQQITLNNRLCTITNNVNELIDKVYPDLLNNYENDDWLCERALLAPTNEHINELNSLLLSKLPGEITTFTSLNTLVFKLHLFLIYFLLHYYVFKNNLLLYFIRNTMMTL